ncbi:AraC family transcriptional regulator [Alkaliphilus serpentinus]|uniref:AraC family transcriptional regulator n=1 Tax=Alkaliphilus serpentinus TaxID=1482731 RepID=A0A833HN98_9FIRM|nr:AraC family transcriptional regulator [Alkaliphilus serpentinus]KAB3529315.1 AraC family transcriptional regulator [Alkaliphilus serpentinus]
MSKEIVNNKSKRGYLEKDFALFHIKDRINLELEFHYHDFYKILIFISGKVTYLIEGRAYRLKPWDVLLVNSNELHKPQIDASESYERIVIWVSPAFFEKSNTTECILETCFQLAIKENLNLIRQDPTQLHILRKILSQIEEAQRNSEFGSQLLSNSLFTQFMIYINRLYLGVDKEILQEDFTYDERICSIISYINSNLERDLSIDTIASLFYLNKYYLMHKFKKETGYTLHNYILQKRLIMAKGLIRSGYNITEASARCGFNDYSNFSRAFKKMFDISPQKYVNSITRN